MEGGLPGACFDCGTLLWRRVSTLHIMQVMAALWAAVQSGGQARLAAAIDNAQSWASRHSPRDANAVPVRASWPALTSPQTPDIVMVPPRPCSVACRTCASVAFWVSHLRM